VQQLKPIEEESKHSASAKEKSGSIVSKKSARYQRSERKVENNFVKAFLLHKEDGQDQKDDNNEEA